MLTICTFDAQRKMRYNIHRKNCIAILFGCRLTALRAAVVLTASQKCPCKQAFLHRGIIKPQKKLRGL